MRDKNTNLKSGIAKVIGKSSYWSLHNVLKGGTSFPGKSAVKIDSEVSNLLAEGYETTVATGTNGKTMTTALIVEALKKKYGDILTNPPGSNMQQGIVIVFLAHKNRKAKKKIAVLEIDEANVKMVIKSFHPSVFVLTNIFRDQMDCYGEIHTIYQKTVDEIKLAPNAIIIANRNVSAFSLVEPPNKKIFYGFKLLDDKAENDFKAPVNTDGVLCPKCDHILHYHEQIYANSGDFLCPNRGYHRPELTYSVNQIIDQTPNSLKFKMGEKEYSTDVGGIYNIYNALVAYSVARELDLNEEEVARSFVESKRVFGRQELINYIGKEINLILAKNPVGLDKVLHMLNTEKDNYSSVVLLNADHADGVDASWIRDADCEGLNRDKIKKVLVDGKRWHGMGFRLEAAGSNPGLMTTATNNDALLDEISKLPTKRVHVLAIHTAMPSLRKTMGEKKIIKTGT